MADSRTLEESAFATAAEKLDCDVPAVKAVAEVESSGNGFLSNGDIKILFEGHKFFVFTKGIYAQSNPDICYPKWTRAFYAKGKDADVRGAGELHRLNRAIALDRTAALMSASYGKFQIMGFNFPHCGFKKVGDFYQAMKSGEDAQLDAFCRYLIDVGLDDELREHRWDAYAQKYNGPEYKKNNYDGKLEAAYDKYANG